MLFAPPSGTSPGMITGQGGNYTPDANGYYSVSSQVDIRALVLNGYVPVEVQTKPDLVLALTALAPSATINTYGTASAVTPTADYVKLVPLSMDLVFAGLEI